MDCIKWIKGVYFFSILQLTACSLSEERGEIKNSPCQDPTNIYCLLSNYYVPEIRYPDTPLLLFEYGGWYVMHKEFETTVRPFLRDSLKMESTEIDYMDSSLNMHPVNIHTSDDFRKAFFVHDTTWVWTAQLLKGARIVPHQLVDSVNKVFISKGYAARQELARSLFPHGYIVLSKPVMNREGSVIHFYEQYYGRSENDYARFFLFYRTKKSGWQMKILF